VKAPPPPAPTISPAREAWAAQAASMEKEIVAAISGAAAACSDAPVAAVAQLLQGGSAAPPAAASASDARAYLEVNGPTISAALEAAVGPCMADGSVPAAAHIAEKLLAAATPAPPAVPSLSLGAIGEAKGGEQASAMEEDETIVSPRGDVMPPPPPSLKARNDCIDTSSLPL